MTQLKIAEEMEQRMQALPAAIARMLQPRFPRAAAAVHRVEVDSPLILSLVVVCIAVTLLDSTVLPGVAARHLSVPPWQHFNPTDARHVLRLTMHAVAHSDWAHLHGNLVLVLLVGPACERALGARALLQIMGWTALASGVAHVAIAAPGNFALGASGLVFMLILLNSLLHGASGGKVPLTFLLQVLLWCSGEVAAQGRQLVAGSDGVSHLGHIVGACCGAYFGFKFHHPDGARRWWERGPAAWTKKRG